MLYDISMPIEMSMQVYKNKAEKRPLFETTSDFTTGSAHESRIHLDVHTGTHIDAPLHMIPQGETIESIGLERLVTRCRVLDLTKVTQAISRKDLEAFAIQSGDFLLCKTKNSFSEEFVMDFIYVAEDAATWLADIGIAGIGIDALGIERAQPEHTTHKAFFEKEIIILEGLRLREVPQGEYQLIALPIALVGLDAAPARAILLPLT